MQRQRVQTSRYFSDQLHGGKLKSLRAAKEYRDELEAETPAMNVAQRSRTPSSRNQSGVVGVRLHQQADRRGDYEYAYWYWVAQWTDGHGRRRTRSFSCNKYGEAEAYRLACVARRQGVASARR